MRVARKLYEDELTSEADGTKDEKPKKKSKKKKSKAVPPIVNDYTMVDVEKDFNEIEENIYSDYDKLFDKKALHLEDDEVSQYTYITMYISAIAEAKQGRIRCGFDVSLGLDTSG